MSKEIRGFTLIELLVVIAIIGILAAFIIARVNALRQRAFDVRVQQDFRNIMNRIEIVRGERLLYQVTTSVCTYCACSDRADIHILPDTDGCMVALTNAFVTKLGMNSIPRDPWGNPYLLDENELELPNFCGWDNLHSAGPDHDTFDYSYSINIPHFVCVP